jgi:hypothetical protein
MVIFALMGLASQEAAKMHFERTGANLKCIMVNKSIRQNSKNG